MQNDVHKLFYLILNRKKLKLKTQNAKFLQKMKTLKEINH